MIEVQFDDSEIMEALGKLKVKMTTGRRPVMAEIGEYLTESTKERFADGKGPDGEAWAANSETTINQMLGRTKGNYRKVRGGMSAKGKRRVAGKKPLIGESKALSSGIHYKATKDDVEVGSSMIYAAVQHFGASKGEFGNTKRNTPIPWGDIPARPYLGFSDDDRSEVLTILERYLNI